MYTKWRAYKKPSSNLHQTDLVTSRMKCMKCSVLAKRDCASRAKSLVFLSCKYRDELFKLKAL